MYLQKSAILGAAMAAALATAAGAEVREAVVTRTEAGALAVSWKADHPVQVFVDTATPMQSKAPVLLTSGEASGQYLIPDAGVQRRYFRVVDTQDQKGLTAAERELPLAQGSNFRDVGGYVGAGGKHVRWGLIYRSGGQPMLTRDDVKQVQDLGLVDLVDLRSSEERVIAPTKVMGVPYQAVGYSMMDLLPKDKPLRNGVDIYHGFPTLLAPQMRLLFADLLAGKGAVAYNCSAGQDRTGFATAMILSALGVSRADIINDYHLSTRLRRPQWEMPPLDAAASNDPVVKMFAAYQKHPAPAPEPLMDAQGKAFLQGAFDEIDARWGSVDGYLEKEIGVGPADIAQLRKMYLE